VNVVLLLAFAVALGLGCGDSSEPAMRQPAHDPPCAIEEWEYRDEECRPTSQMAFPDGSYCRAVGDGLCHARCGSDDDCPQSEPHCAWVGIYGRTDAPMCDAQVRVCLAKPIGECE
jgi:hypothetical protein